MVFLLSICLLGAEKFTIDKQDIPEEIKMRLPDFEKDIMIRLYASELALDRD